MKPQTTIETPHGVKAASLFQRLRSVAAFTVEAKDLHQSELEVIAKNLNEAADYIENAYDNAYQTACADIFKSAINRLSQISLKYEKSNNTPCFHVAEECIHDLSKLRHIIETDIGMKQFNARQMAKPFEERNFE